MSAPNWRAKLWQQDPDRAHAYWQEWVNLRMSLMGDGEHRVSLDQVITTMAQTGKDMSHKYKETALSGLAVNVVEY